MSLYFGVKVARVIFDGQRSKDECISITLSQAIRGIVEQNPDMELLQMPTITPFVYNDELYFIVACPVGQS